MPAGSLTLYHDSDHSRGHREVFRRCGGTSSREKHHPQASRTRGRQAAVLRIQRLPATRRLECGCPSRFRKTWKFAATSAVKRLECLRGFLRFCEESEWIERNPAKAIKPPKVTHKPTMPFEEPEIERTLKAAEQLSEWGSFGPKLKAMVLLLRHSGLRIQDAACLERARLKESKLFVYTQKTGTPVHCPLPPQVVELLEGKCSSQKPAGSSPCGEPTPKTLLINNLRYRPSVLSNFHRLSR